MFEIQENITKPERSNSTFPFKDIPVGGAMTVVPTDGESFEKLEMRVRNAVASFKKANKEFKLSVHTLAPEQELVVKNEAAVVETETILVYRNAE